ncbi:MAG: LptA/OstA family protein, partial [Pseudomonadota bacterium]
PRAQGALYALPNSQPIHAGVFMSNFFSRFQRLAIFSVGLLGMIVPAAHGQRIGIGNEAIYVSSEFAEATEAQFIWEENVRIVQGKAILTADKVVGTLTGKGDISEIIATGKVRYSDGTQAITGDRGTYNETARTLTIVGDVILTQGENVFTAGEAVYWIDTGRVRFRPKPGKRVRGLINPDSKLRLN